jgi:hypothetical protein
MSAREGIPVHKFCAYSLNYEEIIGRKTTYHVHRKPPKYSSQEYSWHLLVSGTLQAFPKNKEVFLMSYDEHDMLPFLLRFLIFTHTQDLFKSESFTQQVNFVNASKVIKLFHSISLKI